MKKYFNLLSELADIKLFILRYFVNFVILIEILFLPYVLEPDIFVSLEWIKNILIFIPFVLLGINSGYMKLYYRDERDYRNDLMFWGVVIALLSFVIITFTLDFLFAIAVLFYLVIMSVEKILIVDGHLLLASLYKAIFSLTLIILVLVSYVTQPVEIDIIYFASIIFGAIVWLILAKGKYKFNVMEFKPNGKRIYELIDNGLFI